MLYLLWLISFEEGKVILPKNSTLVCYTDGLSELENTKLEEFGIEGIEKSMSNNGDLNMTDLNEIIINDAIKHKGKMPYIDDIALFSIKFK